MKERSFEFWAAAYVVFLVCAAVACAAAMMAAG
jgi:hypothetical protein